MNSYPQCPNCGGFKTFRPRDQWEEENKPASAGASTGAVIITLALFFVFPIGTIISLYIWWKWLNPDPKKPAPSPILYNCQLCGYKWEQQPGQVLSINVRPDLIQQGEQRLKEEAEERQRQAQAQRDAEAAFLLSQQNKK